MTSYQARIIDALKASATLQDAMPCGTLEAMDFAAEPAQVSVFDGPVVGVSVQMPRRLRLSLYCDDGDDIDALSKALGAAVSGLALDLEILPARRTPIFDEADFPIGACLDFEMRRIVRPATQAAA